MAFADQPNHLPSYDTAQQLLEAGVYTPDQFDQMATIQGWPKQGGPSNPLSQFMAAQTLAEQSPPAERKAPAEAPPAAKGTTDESKPSSVQGVAGLTDEQKKNPSLNADLSMGLKQVPSSHPDVSPVTGQAAGDTAITPPSPGPNAPANGGNPVLHKAISRGAVGGPAAGKPGQSAADIMMGTTVQHSAEENTALRKQQEAILAKAQGEADVNTYRADATKGAVESFNAQKTKDDALMQQARAEADANTARLTKQSQQAGATKVDPDRYFKSMDNKGRFWAGLGLLLGAGGGPQGNGAAQVITQAVDRDVDAQKHDIANAHASIHEQMGLSNDKFTRDLQLDEHALNARITGYKMAKDQINERSLQVGNPAIMAEAQQAVGVLDQKIADFTADVGNTKYMLKRQQEVAQMQEGSRQRALAEEQLKEERADLYKRRENLLQHQYKMEEEAGKPGGGAAKQKQIDDARTRLTTIVSELQDLNTEAGRTGLWNPNARAKAVALHAEAQQLMPLATSGTTRTPSETEQKLTSQRVPNIANPGLGGLVRPFTAGSDTQTKLDELNKSMKGPAPTPQE
jgi:hypothetical protein